MADSLTPDKLPKTTELAMVRTQLAHERTLMAWIRTAFSMISFGFTILKTFEYLKDSALTSQRPMLGPRNLGMTLILLGTASLVGASWQHWRLLKQMQAAGTKGGLSLPLIVAFVVMAVGVLAFIGAVFRTGIF